VNPAPLAVICVMVTLAVPELVSFTDCVAFIPTLTLPKARLRGLAVTR